MMLENLGLGQCFSDVLAVMPGSIVAYQIDTITGELSTNFINKLCRVFLIKAFGLHRDHFSLRPDNGCIKDDLFFPGELDSI